MIHGWPSIEDIDGQLSQKQSVIRAKNAHKGIEHAAVEQRHPCSPGLADAEITARLTHFLERIRFRLLAGSQLLRPGDGFLLVFLLLRLQLIPFLLSIWIGRKILRSREQLTFPKEEFGLSELGKSCAEPGRHCDLIGWLNAADDLTPRHAGLLLLLVPMIGFCDDVLIAGPAIGSQEHMPLFSLRILLDGETGVFCYRRS